MQERCFWGRGVLPPELGREGRMVDLAVLVYWRGEREVRGSEGYSGSRAEWLVLCKILELKSYV
jgi:hypothetical protein